MHTSILQMSCSTNKFGVLYCFFPKKQKVEGTWLNSFNWLIHEQLVDLKACTLQMGARYQGQSVGVDSGNGWPLMWSSSQKLDGIAVEEFGKGSKGPDVNQYIRSCAMYFFGICLFLLPFFCSISCIHPWLCLEAIRQDVCLTQWCWGWIPSLFFTANWSGPWVVWLAWSFDPGPKWFWKFHFSASRWIWELAEVGRSSVSRFQKRSHYQRLFLVPLIGGRYHIIPQLTVYTTYIPRLYCHIYRLYTANWGTRKFHWN